MHETVKHLLLPVFLAMTLGVIAPCALAHDHEHSHDEAAPQELMLKNGQKWATNDTLRQAMSRIRAEMAIAQPEGGMTLPRYQEQAKKINGQIAFMVQNCKLDKEADAMLHLVLADIIAGADAMSGQDLSKARKGAEQVAHALANYGTYFEHPGWH